MHKCARLEPGSLSASTPWHPLMVTGLLTRNKQTGQHLKAQPLIFRCLHAHFPYLYSLLACLDLFAAIINTEITKQIKVTQNVEIS